MIRTTIVKATYGIPDAAISIIKSFQPYHGGDDYKSTHLWKLNTLWNIEKHRHIIPHGVSTGWLFNITPSIQGVDIQTQELDDGGIIKIPIALKEKVTFNPDPGEVDFFFGDKREGTNLSLKDITEMYQFVAVEVLPAFTSFLPK